MAAVVSRLPVARPPPVRLHVRPHDERGGLDGLLEALRVALGDLAVRLLLRGFGFGGLGLLNEGCGGICGRADVPLWNPQ